MFPITSAQAQLKSYLSKVGRTGGQDHLVRLQVQSVAGNRDIHESFMIEKILEDGKKIVLVVVPAETVLLGLAGGGDSHGEGGQGLGLHQYRQNGNLLLTNLKQQTNISEHISMDRTSIE